MATEFSCQGLELDSEDLMVFSNGVSRIKMMHEAPYFPIVCWGNDFLWQENQWKSPKATRSKAKDPHQLRVNSYRVLLTRGRDGFIIFVPNEIGMRSTYEALKGAGVRELVAGNDVGMMREKGWVGG